MARRKKSGGGSWTGLLLLVAAIYLWPIALAVIVIVGIIKLISFFVSRSGSSSLESSRKYHPSIGSIDLSDDDGDDGDEDDDEEEEEENYRIKYCPQCGIHLRDYWRKCGECKYYFDEDEEPIYTRPKPTSYNYWLTSMYKGKHQRDRFLRSYDVKIKAHAPDFRWANVYSSDGSDVYTVTCASCDCMDFKRRGVPCKHMYAVMREAGLIESIQEFYEIPLELTAQIDALHICKPEASAAFVSLISEASTRLLVSRSDSDFKHIKDICEFALAEHSDLTADDLISYVDSYYTLQEFKDLCRLSCSDVKFPKLKKRELIEFTLSQREKLSDYFAKQVQAVVFPEDVIRLRSNIRDYHYEQLLSLDYSQIQS
jgi:hypothetical protein